MSKTAVITGATGGIGKEIARGLIREGMTVVIGVRSIAKGEALHAELAREWNGARIEVLPLDLASLASVRAFAAVVAERHPAIQLLVNNAGAWFNERRETVDGHELTLATNVLGPYLLGRLLSPRLLAGQPARVINIVSSAAGSFDVDDLDWTRRAYDGFKAYSQSKQALMMLTWTLAQRLAGSGVVVNAVSPGFVKTAFLNEARGFVPVLLRLISPLAAVTPEKGAATPLWVALAPELARVTGKYFESGKEKDGKFRDQHARDELDRVLDAMTATPHTAGLAGPTRSRMAIGAGLSTCAGIYSTGGPVGQCRSSGRSERRPMHVSEGVLSERNWA